MAIPTELHDLLERSLRYTQETGGAFRPTVGPLVELWKRAEEVNRRPTAEALAEAAGLASADLVEIEERTEGRGARARRLRERVRIEFGAIGKGWAVDRATAVLRNEGIRHALVNAGTSTMRGIGSDGAGRGVVAIRNPSIGGRAVCDFLLEDAAVSTSASYERNYEIDGGRYSHIVDPRSGMPAEALKSATVIAPSATEADALSTAVCVLGGTEGPELLARLDREGHLIDAEGRTWASGRTWRRGQRWR